MDLLELYEFIANASGPNRALGYIERIEDWCKSLQTFPERGNRRDDIRPVLRVMGFEHRVSIAFQVGADTVTILRILYAGREMERAFGRSPGAEMIFTQIVAGVSSQESNLVTHLLVK